MLVKKKLLQIPLPEYPKGLKEKKFEVTVQSEVVGEIYQLAVWHEKELIRRTFSDGKNIIHYDVEMDRWDANLINEYEFNYVETKKSANSTEEFFKGFSCSSVRNINYKIQEARTEKRQKAAANRYERMMNRIKSFPADPKDIGEYCEQYVFKNKFAILRKGEKNRTKEKCKCLMCGKSFTYKGKLRHKEEVRCPKCGEAVKAIAERYISVTREKAKITVFFKNEKNDIMVRWENIERVFDANGKPTYEKDSFRWEIHEAQGKTYRYYYGNVGCGYDYREDKYDSKCVSACVYDKKLNEVFKNTPVDIDLEKLHLAGSVTIKSLIWNTKNIAAARTLYKIGLYRLADESNTYSMSLEKDTFEGVLGVQAKYYQIMKKLNISLSALKIMRLAEIHLTDELITKIAFIAEKSGYEVEKQLKAMQKYMGFERMINYLYKQRVLRPKTDLTTIINWYLDYRSMAEELNKQLKKGRKLDTTKSAFIMPRDIKVAHDGVSSKLKVIKDKGKERIIRNVGIRLQRRRSFSYKNLIVVYPLSIDDFIREGATLRHCVGNNPTYKDSQANGSMLTIFIRKKDNTDKPYQTATFYPKKQYKLRETYGDNHKLATKEITEFIKAYQNFMNEQEAKKAA